MLPMNNIALRWGPGGGRGDDGFRMPACDRIVGLPRVMGAESKGRKVLNSKQLQKGKEQRYVLAQWVCGPPWAQACA